MVSNVSTKVEKQSGSFLQISISSCNEKVGYFDMIKLKSNTVGRSKLRFRREIRLISAYEYPNASANILQSLLVTQASSK